MAIPALTAYLNSRGIRADALDLNNAFYYWLLTPENINAAYAHAAEEFKALNGKPALSPDEAAAYLRLVSVLPRVQPHMAELKALTAPWGLMKAYTKIQAIIMALKLISARYHPETLDMTPIWPYAMAYTSAYDEFSSDDILKATEDAGILSGFFEEALTPVLAEQAPDVVGISVGFQSQVLAAFRCAVVIKRISPRTHVTLGGGFVSCFMRRVENTKLFGLVDSIVLDNGEVPLERLIREINTSSPEVSRVPGLIYCENGNIKSTPPGSPPAIETLPVPDYGAFPLDSYPFPPGSPVFKIAYRLSSGCRWHRCAFCRTDLSMVHERQDPDPDYLFESLKTIVEKTGSRNFKFGDEEVEPDALETLCNRIIKEKLEIKWSANARFDPGFTESRCRLFRKAGCKILFLGMESFNDRLLKLINKGTSVKLINRVLGDMKKAGLPAAVYMMVGIPTETEQEALNGFTGIDLLLRSGLINFYHYSMFQVLPGTAVFNDPHKYGIASFEIDPDRDFNHPMIFFNGTGMARQKAAELEQKFNAARFNDQVIDPRKIKGLNIKGEEIALKFDLSELMTSMKDHTPVAAHTSISAIMTG